MTSRKAVIRDHGSFAPQTADHRSDATRSACHMVGVDDVGGPQSPRQADGDRMRRMAEVSEWAERSQP